MRTMRRAHGSGTKLTKTTKTTKNFVIFVIFVAFVTQPSAVECHELPHPALSRRRGADRAADHPAPAAARRGAAGAVHRGQPAAARARWIGRGSTGCATSCCSPRASRRCCCSPAPSRGRTSPARRRPAARRSSPSIDRSAWPRRRASSAPARWRARRSTSRRAIASRSSPSTIAPTSSRRPAPPRTRAPRSPRSTPGFGGDPLCRRVRQGRGAPAGRGRRRGSSSSAICSAAASTKTSAVLPEGIDLQVRDAGAASGEPVGDQRRDRPAAASRSPPSAISARAVRTADVRATVDDRPCRRSA